MFKTNTETDGHNTRTRPPWPEKTFTFPHATQISFFGESWNGGSFMARYKEPCRVKPVSIAGFCCCESVVQRPGKGGE